MSQIQFPFERLQAIHPGWDHMAYAVTFATPALPSPGSQQSGSGMLRYRPLVGKSAIGWRILRTRIWMKK